MEARDHIGRAWYGGYHPWHLHCNNAPLQRTRRAALGAARGVGSGETRTRASHRVIFPKVLRASR